IYRKTDFAQPYFDVLGRPVVYPAFHVIAGLARDGGRPLLEAVSARPEAVDVLAYRAAGGTIVWLCNLTAHPGAVSFSGLPSTGAKAAVVDAESFAQVTTDTDALDALARPLKERALELDAYAVARIVAGS